MNFIEGGILNNTGNTNGLSSFTGGNGSIVLDIAPWMTTNYTSNAGIPRLREQPEHAACWPANCPPAAQTNIISYVANTNNFPTARRPRKPRCATASAPSFI